MPRDRFRSMRLTREEDRLLTAAAEAEAVPISALARRGALELAREAVLRRHAAAAAEEGDGAEG